MKTEVRKVQVDEFFLRFNKEEIQNLVKHPGEIVPILTKLLVGSDTTCPQCGRVFLFRRGLGRHLATAHTVHRVVRHAYAGALCKVCGRKCKNTQGLAKHMDWHNRGPEPKFHCGVCGVGLWTRHGKTIHEATHK